MDIHDRLNYPFVCNLHRCEFLFHRFFVVVGAKVIALRDGTLDLHGNLTVRTWTQLGATAANGSSTISLLKSVNWTINSEIIIATTSDRLSQRESEVRRISNISSDGLTLTLDKPLMYTHLGVTQQVNTTSIEVRGEIGLLSHNVIVQGRDDRYHDQERIDVLLLMFRFGH